MRFTLGFGTNAARRPINSIGLSTGPRTVAGKARIAATHYKHGRYVGYREKQARERYYRDKIKRIMQQVFEAGLMPE